MSEHVIHLLSAYHDRELSVQRMLQVEHHLESCADCRKELERIQALSRLLQAYPLPVTARSQQRFGSQVNLQLTRREAVGPVRQRLWSLFPFGLAGLWGIVQAIFIVAFFVSVVLRSGIIPQVSTWMPAQGSSVWAALLAQAAAPDLGQVAWLMLQEVTLTDPLLQGIVLYLLIQLVFAVLFCAWLAGCYIRTTRPVPARV